MFPAPIVREVWGYNLASELTFLYQSLWGIDYRFGSLDTEFPGTIITIPSQVPKFQYASSPDENYLILKKNTHLLKIIQLGLSLCDANGVTYTWNFNFRDFNPRFDMYNPESIKMLCDKGIDFSVNLKWGIDMHTFALGFKPILDVLRHKNLVWVTFQGSYDFSLLIKNLQGIGKRLPDDVESFMNLVGHYFGFATVDMKLVTRSMGIHGGLEKVAKQLGFHRITGVKHQAGSDSLVVMQVFLELCNKYPQVACSRDYTHKLYGLTKLHSGTLHSSSSSSCV